VLNAQSYAGYVVHVGTLGAAGSVAVGNAATVHVDYDRRALVAPNHTMTHVLNFALRSVLVFNNPTGSAGTSRHTLQPPAFFFIAISFVFFFFLFFPPSGLCFFSLVFVFLLYLHFIFILLLFAAHLLLPLLLVYCVVLLHNRGHHRERGLDAVRPEGLFGGRREAAVRLLLVRRPHTRAGR
jgi:hypothetical protein